MVIQLTRVPILKLRFSKFTFSKEWACALALAMAGSASAQTPLTWDQVKQRFIGANPTLMASQVNVDEAKLNEITAFLRPNPDFSFSSDGTQVAPSQGVWQPFGGTLFTPSVSYLHERQHKRELRLESARKATGIAALQEADQERTLLFNLRNAFVQTLQAKHLQALAKEELDYFEKQYGITQDRYHAGDIAQMDMQRVHLQRVQYESDYQTALTNLRTAKITLLALLDQRTPVDQFDVDGRFDFDQNIDPLEHFHQIALDQRPDLRAAVAAIEKAEADHRLAVANGSTDPTFGVWFTHNGSFSNPTAVNTLGASVSIPLRLFDRNQGEKARTEIDIRHAQRLKDATQAQVFSDVDSAYFALTSAVTLLMPYKTTYLSEALEIRDKVAFSYQRGGAALLDYLQGQQDYRAVQQAYVNLIASYLVAAAQLNMAVGQEVIQ
jgi:outer membrane protein, heavy metal efflux system